MKNAWSGLAAVVAAVFPTMGCIDSVEPIEPGAYELVGEATLTSDRSGDYLREERLALFVPEESAGTWYLGRGSEMIRLAFADGATVSENACAQEGCDLRVDATSGCATVVYTDYQVPFQFGGPCQDAYDTYNGTVTACPNGEAYGESVFVRGATVPDAILPDGRAIVSMNYPWDPARDALHVEVDGVEVSAPSVVEGANGFALELGATPIGAEIAITYTGTRSVVLDAATALSTTETLTDLTLATEPPSGASDARGVTFGYEGADLVVEDAGMCPRTPFAIAIALGDPALASVLHITADHIVREGGYTSFAIVRADASVGTDITMHAETELDVPVPAGEGDAWLLLTNEQDVFVPSDRADSRVLSVHALEWR